MEERSVSIPIGFSSSLQPRRNPDRSCSTLGFNPYRVFKFVATFCHPQLTIVISTVSIPIGFSSSLQRCVSPVIAVADTSFNPYRVFKFVATKKLKPGRPKGVKVSIPIGFSSSLQPRDRRIACGDRAGFQSLSGFQVRCNRLIG